MSSSRPHRRQLLQAAGALAVLGLAGACARIPTSSDIDVQQIRGSSGGSAPYVRALPPADGATAIEVVRGFVQAGVGPEDDYAVAREYLAEESRASWDPRAGITIYSGSREIQLEDSGAGTVSLTVTAVAAVDSTGVRSPLAGTSTREVDVVLKDVDGQWRITEVPDGIFLSEAAFDALFAPGLLYFVDATGEHLVPDARWFALHDAAPGVLALLSEGPSPVLKDAVRTEVPRSSSFASAEVTTAADGTSQVTVPTTVSRLPLSRRVLALAQMESSLRSVRTLAGVKLIGEGVDAASSGQRPERALPGHRPFAAGIHGVVSLGDVSTVGTASQLIPDLTDTAVRAPALARSGVLAAALVADRSGVIISSTDGSVQRRDVATGGSYVRPCIDDAGYVWTTPQRSVGVLLALSGAGSEHDVTIDASWLADREVLALDLAADGTRLLVLSADAAGPRVDQCAVIRDDDGVPGAVTDPREKRIPQFSDIQKVSWYDETAVLVLGEDAGTSEQRAAVVDESGREPLPPFERPVENVAGSVVAETFWASGGGGVLLRSDGESWVQVDAEAFDPGFY